MFEILCYLLIKLLCRTLSKSVFDTDIKVILQSQKSLLIILSSSMKIWTALYFGWAKLTSRISKKGIKIELEVPKKVLP